MPTPLPRMLFFILALIFFLPGYSQHQVEFDTSTVTVRYFSSPSLEKYKADPVFQYELVNEPPRSLWDRFWDWFWGKINSLLDTETGQYTFRAVLIILAVSILVFFILKLTGMSNIGLFGKKNRDDALGYSVTDDNIHTINFGAAIQQAIADRNFRFAVRLLYLQTLKNLADTGLINWQVNKTNEAYVEELNNADYRQNFRRLTLQFENNWYGDLPIEENEFKLVSDQFNEFNKRIL